MKPPRHRFRNRPPRDGGGGTLFNVITTVDATDEELVTTARNAATQAPGPNRFVFMGVYGYDDDPRELHEIPEVRPHMRRLVDFGFISILTRSSMLPELGGIGGPFRAFGAFEVWAFAEGMFAGGRIEFTSADVDRFVKDVYPSAGEALRRNLRKFADVPANPDLMLVGGPGCAGLPTSQFAAAVEGSIDAIRPMLSGHLEARPDSDPVVFLLDPSDEQAQFVWKTLQKLIPGNWHGPRGADEERILVAVVDYREIQEGVPPGVRKRADHHRHGTRIILITEGRTEVQFVRLDD